MLAAAETNSPAVSDLRKSPPAQAVSSRCQSVSIAFSFRCPPRDTGGEKPIPGRKDMARRDPTNEFWTRAKEERGRREGDKKYRRRVLRAAEKRPSHEAPREFDLNRIVSEARSTDEMVRAKAARNLCPCRIG